MGKTQIGTSTIIKKMFGNSEVVKEVFNGATVYEKSVLITASVTGLGVSNPNSVSFTVDSEFTVANLCEEVTFNGDTFVKIPTMYRKVVTISNGEPTAYIVSNYQLDNSYLPYPCFIDEQNNILPYILIGKYCFSSTSAAGSTTSGSATMSMSDARVKARARGTGYQLIDWKIRQLILDLCLMISQKVNFSSLSRTDYLGIYDLDKFMGIDGCAAYNLNFYVAYDTAKYVSYVDDSTNGYSKLSYSYPGGNQKEITKINYDASHPFANFPTNSGTNSAYDTYYCDAVWYSSGHHAIGWNLGGGTPEYGLWCFNMSANYDFAYFNHRLCYRPLSS